MSISKDVARAVVLLPCNRLMHVIPVSLQVMLWYYNYMVWKILGMRNATCVCVCVYTHECACVHVCMCVCNYEPLVNAISILSVYIIVLECTDCMMPAYSYTVLSCTTTI